MDFTTLALKVMKMYPLDITTSEFPKDQSHDKKFQFDF
jgi:hypothetical protein